MLKIDDYTLAAHERHIRDARFPNRSRDHGQQIIQPVGPDDPRTGGLYTGAQNIIDIGGDPAVDKPWTHGFSAIDFSDLAVDDLDPAIRPQTQQIVDTNASCGLWGLRIHHLSCGLFSALLYLMHIHRFSYPPPTPFLHARSILHDIGRDVRNRVILREIDALTPEVEYNKRTWSGDIPHYARL
jgi:hypothetical protein